MLLDGAGTRDIATDPGRRKLRRLQRLNSEEGREDTMQLWAVTPGRISLPAGVSRLPEKPTRCPWRSRCWPRPASWRSAWKTRAACLRAAGPRLPYPVHRRPSAKRCKRQRVSESRTSGKPGPRTNPAVDLSARNHLRRPGIARRRTVPMFDRIHQEHRGVERALSPRRPTPRS